MKEDHEELHKYNTIVKGELIQCKKKLEKLYSIREKLDDSMSIQRPTYDKTSLGYLFNMSTKKPKSGSNMKVKDKSDDKIESSQSFDNPKKLDKRRKLRNWMNLSKWNLLRKLGMNLEVNVFHVMK